MSAIDDLSKITDQVIKLAEQKQADTNQLYQEISRLITQGVDHNNHPPHLQGTDHQAD